MKCLSPQITELIRHLYVSQSGALRIDEPESRSLLIKGDYRILFDKNEVIRFIFFVTCELRANELCVKIALSD